MPGYSLTDQHKVTKVKDTERFHTIPLHQAEPGTHLTKHGNTNPAFIPDNFDEQTETPPDISVTNGGPADSIVINGGTPQSIITHGGPPDSIVTCGGKQDSTRKPLENGEKRLNLLAEDGVLPTAEASGLHRVYRQRWLMLGLFCLYSFSNAFQWIHLNIISNVLANYYNASLPEDSYQRNTAIDWLSMVYMLAYIPFIFPANWLLNRKGLRICCIVGSLLNCVGAGLKLASVSPDRFGLLMFAQAICAVSQLWVLGIPARLAAVWFGPNEVSTATSFGVFGNQVGIAVGFLIPPILVPNSSDFDDLTRHFYIMFIIGAVVTFVIFLLICILFQDKPPNPPSRAQLLSVENAANENYLQSLVHLFKNKGFLVLMVAYGINTGSFYAISTLLNTIVLNYFENEEENAGRIGLTIVLMGVAGAVLAGIWLDKTKTFKATTIAIYVLSLAGTVAFTFTLDLEAIWIVYVTAGSLGFFMTGYLPVGFEFAAELTFPESEGTSSGLLNAAAQIFGIIMTIGMRAMMESISVLSANITMCSLLLVGAIITSLIKADYRRQEAGKAVIGDVLKDTEEIVDTPEENKVFKSPAKGVNNQQNNSL